MNKRLCLVEESKLGKTENASLVVSIFTQCTEHIVLSESRIHLNGTIIPLSCTF